MENKQLERLLMTVGLAAKARRIIFGTDQVCDSLRDSKNSPVLVIEAKDTSENTHKKLTDKCKYYGVRLVRIEAGTAELGRAVGKLSATAAVGITDSGIAKAIYAKLEEASGEPKM
jgi:ribosomal protein L7Ae-like RNA K-turn-binding protein